MHYHGKHTTHVKTASLEAKGSISTEAAFCNMCVADRDGWPSCIMGELRVFGGALNICRQWQIDEYKMSINMEHW